MFDFSLYWNHTSPEASHVSSSSKSSSGFFRRVNKNQSQNPSQGRRSKAEGNRRRWIRTLMQFLWMIFSVFIGIWLLCFTSKVYMKNIVLDLWDDSSRIQFKEEYSNLMEGEKGVLNLIQLVWYGKNNESKNVFNRIFTKCYQSVLSSQLKFITSSIALNWEVQPLLWHEPNTKILLFCISLDLFWINFSFTPIKQG